MRWRGEDGRLRAGWRIAVFVGLFYLLALPSSLALRAFVGSRPADPVHRSFAISVLVALVATIAVAVARRRIDRRPVASLGLPLRQAPLELAVGFLFSGAVVAGSVAVLVALGWARVELSGLSWTRLLLVFFGTAGLIAWFEEIVFRGYLLRNLSEGLGMRWAIAVSCVLYGLVHALNPHAGVASFIVISAIGFKHLYGWLVTGRLWLAMGMHAGWNFTQGAIFGMPVSGRALDSAWRTTLDGPEWATGAGFGIEATPFGFVYALLGLLVTWLWGRIVPRSTRSAADA
jgi:membrane protease YdiL (CAAX protease family)